jgi:hypothetical protein
MEKYIDKFYVVDLYVGSGEYSYSMYFATEQTAKEFYDEAMIHFKSYVSNDYPGLPWIEKHDDNSPVK